MDVFQKIFLGGARIKITLFFLSKRVRGGVKYYIINYDLKNYFFKIILLTKFQGKRHLLLPPVNVHEYKRQ